MQKVCYKRPRLKSIELIEWNEGCVRTAYPHLVAVWSHEACWSTCHLGASVQIGAKASKCVYVCCSLTRSVTFTLLTK